LAVRRGSLSECSYASDYFDAVTMFHVIEHLHDPISDLQQAYRLLKKGGLLVIVTPNAASLGHRVFAGDWVHLDPPRHLHIFGCHSLAALTQRVGLEVDKLFTTVRWAAFALAHSMLIRRRGRSSFNAAPPRLLYELARASSLIEWVMLTFRPLLGEEIVLLAQKA